jgi:hypothetical protein
MRTDFQVQQTGLQGREWKTVCRAPETRARDVFRRQLRYSSIGRFRLLDPDGRVLEERTARPLFFRDEEATWNQAPSSRQPPEQERPHQHEGS